MKGLGNRIAVLRKTMGVSQQALALQAKVHFTNVSKYERDESIPSADVLNRIAKALDVTNDYLLNGTLDDKAKTGLTDHELLIQFKKVELLPQEKKKLIKEFLDAFIFKATVEQLSK